MFWYIVFVLLAFCVEIVEIHKDSHIDPKIKQFLFAGLQKHTLILDGFIQLTFWIPLVLTRGSTGPNAIFQFDSL